jgi:hypothetical protein
MTGAAYVAMAMGIVVAVLLGVGLMTRLFYSSRRDQD